MNDFFKYSVKSADEVLFVGFAFRLKEVEIVLIHPQLFTIFFNLSFTKDVVGLLAKPKGITKYS